MMRNIANPAESEAFRTMSYSPLKSFNDPTICWSPPEQINREDSIVEKREWFSKSPWDFNSIGADESQRSYLRPIQPM